MTRQVRRLRDLRSHVAGYANRLIEQVIEVGKNLIQGVSEVAELKEERRPSESERGRFPRRPFPEESLGVIPEKPSLLERREKLLKEQKTPLKSSLLRRTDK